MIDQFARDIRYRDILLREGGLSFFQPAPCSPYIDTPRVGSESGKYCSGRTLGYVKYPPSTLVAYEGTWRLLEIYPPSTLVDYEGPTRVREHEGTWRLLLIDPPSTLVAYEGPTRVREHEGTWRLLEIDPPSTVMNR